MHEMVGEVVASMHADIEVGQRVVGWASGYNAMAEYVIADGDGLETYTPTLQPHIAVMLQPLACVLHALERIPDVSGLDVAVIGQGPIGLLFSHVAKTMGARRVIGIDRVDRSDIAASFGVDEALHSASDRWAASLGKRERPQVVVEAVGHQPSTLQHAVDAAAPGGYIYCFGVSDDASCLFPIDAFLRKNLTMGSGFTTERRRMLAAADSYLSTYPTLKDIYVTNVFAADNSQSAFELASFPARGQVKVAVTMTE